MNLLPSGGGVALGCLATLLFRLTFCFPTLAARARVNHSAWGPRIPFALPWLCPLGVKEVMVETQEVHSRIASAT